MDINIFNEHESQVRSYCRKYPTIFTHAKNAELFDIHGNHYIDFLASAGSINYGHNNPEIKQAILNYLSEDKPINMLDMFTEAKAEFIDTFNKEILQPRKFNYKIMCCGPTGTNGVEAALKLARKNTGRINIFAFSGGFHGMSLGSLSCTTDKTSRLGAGIPLNNVTHIPYDGTNYINSLAYLKGILNDDHSGIDKPAAIILETIQAEGGVNIASIPWLKEIREICTKENIIMIIDDIQVGNGRSGPFFSFERANIIPDIVIMSKSISGFGIPMCILLINPNLDIFSPGEHNGTFRGNQLAFVGGTAAIHYFTSHNLEEEVKRKEQIIKEFLNPYILKYRGMGLIWGIDLSIDPTITPKVIQQCFNTGLIIESAGRKDSVLKIMPPLTIEDQLLKQGLAILVDAINYIWR